MTETRRFTSVVDYTQQPLHFIFDGRTTPTEEHPEGEPWEESFTTLAMLPPGTLADLSAAATVNDDGDIVYHHVACLRFLRGALIPEDVPRFDDLVRSRSKLVDSDVVGQAMLYVVGEKSGRPTGPRPSSPDGSSSNGDGSADSSSSEATEPTGSIEPPT